MSKFRKTTYKLGFSFPTYTSASLVQADRKYITAPPTLLEEASADVEEKRKERERSLALIRATARRWTIH